MSTETLARHSLNGNGGNTLTNSETGLGSLHNEMNQVFDRFFDTFPYARKLKRGSQLKLHIDVADCGDSVKVVAECPGMEQDDIDISWADGILTLKGEKKSFWEKESTNLYRSERVFGSFHRQVSLPAEVEAEKIEAFYKNGVLTVTLPKSQEAKNQAKKITIAAE